MREGKPDHCKGCVIWHRAGHNGKTALEKYNSWCCKYGSTAKSAVGRCKLENGKVTEGV